MILITQQETSKEALLEMMEEEELKDAALLVFANKQDLPGALTDAQISDGLGLASLTKRSWAIYKTSATKGIGLYEGLDWYLYYHLYNILIL